MLNTGNETYSRYQEHVCVWCKSALFQRRSHSIPEGPVREIIAASIHPRQVPEGGLVCYSCWVYFSGLIQESVQTPGSVRASSQDTNVCVWCRRSLTQRRSHVLLEGPERNEIAERISPRQLPNGGRVCYACWVAAQRIVRRQDAHNIVRQLEDEDVDRRENDQAIIHDRNACAWCRSSLFHRRTHILRDNPERDIVSSGILPREIPADALVCMGCWRLIQELKVNPNVIAAPEATIQLDDYTHTTHSSAHCFVPGCTELERLYVPVYLKKRILISKKVFVTENAKTCQVHSSFYDWDILDQFEFSSTFTKNEVQSLLRLTTEAEEASGIPIDFKNYINVDDNIFVIGLVSPNPIMKPY